MSECPYCGGESGLYFTVHQTYQQCFGWNGENYGPTDDAGETVSKRAYCADCHKVVTKFVKKIRPYNIYAHSWGRKVYDMGETIL